MHRLTITDHSDPNGPPALERDFPTLSAVIAGLVEVVVDMHDETTKLEPIEYPDDLYEVTPMWEWVLTADSILADCDPNEDPVPDVHVTIEYFED